MLNMCFEIVKGKFCSRELRRSTTYSDNFLTTTSGLPNTTGVVFFFKFSLEQTKCSKAVSMSVFPQDQALGVGAPISTASCFVKGVTSALPSDVHTRAEHIRPSSKWPATAPH